MATVSGLDVLLIAATESVSLTAPHMRLKNAYGASGVNVTLTASNGDLFTIDNSDGGGAINFNSGALIVPKGMIYQVSVGASTTLTKRKILSDINNEDDVQESLSRAKQLGSVTDLAGGEIMVTDTLLSPHVLGGALRGKGVAEPIAYGHTLQGIASRLIWAGDRNPASVLSMAYWGNPPKEPGVPLQSPTLLPSTRPRDTLLHVTGGELVLETLCLDGATRDQITGGSPVAKCPVGVLVNRTGPGIGTGEFHARKLALNYFEVGIQFATNLWEHSCDATTWYDVFFHRCDTAVKTRNIQGMGQVFFRPRFWQTSIGFDFEAGGDLTCYGAYSASNFTFLKFRNNDAYGFGGNNSKYHIYGMKLDTSARESLLVDMEAGDSYIDYQADIVFDGLHIGVDAAPTSATMFNISDATALHVRNSKNLRNSMFKWNTSGSKSLIVVENCRLDNNVAAPEDLFDDANSTGTCMCVVRNCYVDGSNSMVNFSGVL